MPGVSQYGESQEFSDAGTEVYFFNASVSWRTPKEEQERIFFEHSLHPLSYDILLLDIGILSTTLSLFAILDAKVCEDFAII